MSCSRESIWSARKVGRNKQQRGYGGNSDEAGGGEGGGGGGLWVRVGVKVRV